MQEKLNVRLIYYAWLLVYTIFRLYYIIRVL